MLHALITVVVVANVIPILPIVLGFTEGLERGARRKLLMEALLMGNVVALAMAAGGWVLLDVTDVSVADVQIAGGVILLVFSVHDLLFSRERRKRGLADAIGGEQDDDVALVPLAVPLLVGPATLATVLLVSETHGVAIASVAVAVNAAINTVILLFAERVYERLGRGFGRALGKVMGLILAALAVSIIRHGIVGAALGGAG